MNEQFTVTANGSHEVSFAARNIFISNNTGAWVYVKIGSQQIPDVNSNDLAVPPFTQQSKPIEPGTRFFGFAIGASALPTASAQGGTVVVTFDTDPRNPTSTNISLPGVGYSPVWAYVRASLPAQPSVTTLISAPAAGHRLQIFKVMASYLGNGTFQELVFMNGATIAASTFLVSIVPGGSGTPATVSCDFGNGGIAIANATPINVINEDTSSQSWFAGVQYSVV